MTPDEHRYYATQSRVSDPEERAALLDALPADPGRLVAAVSGLLLHPLFVGPLGITPAAGSEDDVECRRLPRILDRIVARDPAPLDVARPPERRFIGICRDYALLACAALRHPGCRPGSASASRPTSPRATSRITGSASTTRAIGGASSTPSSPRACAPTSRSPSIPPTSPATPSSSPETSGNGRARARSIRRPAGCRGSASSAVDSSPRASPGTWPRSTGARCWPGTSGACRSGSVREPGSRSRWPAASTRSPRSSGRPDPDWLRLREAHDRDEGFRVPPVVTSFTARGPVQAAVDLEPGRPATA